MDVTITIATYGSEEWVKLARERAIPSAEAQGCKVIHRHGATLAQARNETLSLVDSEWVVHLDADDELEPGYIAAMGEGTADLRAPRVRYSACAPPKVPKVWQHTHDCTAGCLVEGNWLIVGTAARADLLRSVGGWEEWGWSEDWAIWLRCHLAGATVEAIPQAVYRAHKSRGSRNHTSNAEKMRWHREIERAILPPRLWRAG